MAFLSKSSAESMYRVAKQACYLQENDDPAEHDIKRFSCVCGKCYEAACDVENKNLRAVWRALIEAQTDIFHWVALAKKQCEQIDGNRTTFTPSPAGIAVSERLLRKIGDVLANHAPPKTAEERV